MSKLTDKFIEEAKEKNIKFNSQVIERPMTNSTGKEVNHKQLILQTALQVTKNKVVPCAVILHDTDQLEYVNYQMDYNRIGQVTDRNALPEILEKINEINSMKSGYYHFVVKPDGELHMRHLGIVGNDTTPAVSTFINGGKILRTILPELKEIEGLDLSNHLN